MSGNFITDACALPRRNYAIEVQFIKLIIKKRANLIAHATYMITLNFFKIFNIPNFVTKVF